MDEKLTEWIAGLSREQLNKVAFEVIDCMINTEDLHFYPGDEDLPNGPYWPGGGQELGED